MPSEGTFQRPEEPSRHPSEVPKNLIAVLHVFRNQIRKNVVHHHAGRLEAVLCQPPPAIAVGNSYTLPDNLSAPPSILAISSFSFQNWHLP